jgi:hypothetical protein
MRVQCTEANKCRIARQTIDSVAAKHAATGWTRDSVGRKQPIEVPQCLEEILGYVEPLEDVETAEVDRNEATGDPLLLIGSGEGALVVSCACTQQPDKPCAISISDIGNFDSDGTCVTLDGPDTVRLAKRYVRKAIARYIAAS